MFESMFESKRSRRFACLTVLLLPFLVLLVFAAGGRRASWPDLLPRESTVLMQASSLIEDHDLAYTRLDFDRLLLAWRGNPPDLELATGGEGRRITFQYPAAYAFYLAPFLAWSPENGIAYANILLLLAAAMFAARALEPRVGAWAAALVAVWLFGSVAFAGVFRADGDVFLLAMALLAAAFWLDADARPEHKPWRALLAGALLAPIILVLPLAILLLPLLIYSLTPENRRQLGWRLVAGTAFGVVALVLVHWWNGGGLYFAATSSFRFTPATGYPAVDFPPTSWADEVKKLSAFNWDGASRFTWGLEPRLILWNLVYFFFGGQVGLVPYFLPLLLLVFVLRPKVLLIVASAWLAFLLLLHPFNFWLGPGALGNRALLPLYGAAIVALPLWRERFAAASGKRLVLALSLPILMAAPFLSGLWLLPADWPYARSAFSQQTAAARYLPLEVSQRWLPGGVVEEIGGIWIAALDESSWVERQKGQLGMDGARATFLVGSGQALSSLLLELGEGAPNEIVVHGGELGERILTADGGISFRLKPELWRRHALWFSPLPLFLYRLEVELPPETQGDTMFRLQPEWQKGAQE